ncbi:hypothetical protein LZ190_23895, partial [Rhodovulum sulfidophilum]|nr:hypothetical protein [Rhodovulum sulfidophilum]
LACESLFVISELESLSADILHALQCFTLNWEPIHGLIGTSLQDRGHPSTGARASDSGLTGTRIRL